MSERTSYAPGTPSWIDIGVPDTAAAAAFYGELFGWSVEWAPQPDAGGYGMFTLNGKMVAGIGPQQAPGIPPYWTVYMTVADADATTALVAANGGTVIAGPMDVFDAGRMSVLQDPLGSFFSIWQPNQHIGAGLVNEPGTFAWNELATAGLAHSTSFYQSVFDWKVMDGSNENATIFGVGTDMVCGAHLAGPGEFPAWSIWFAVADCDASAAKVAELGGAVLMPPNDMDFGRGAVVADPSGAVFGIGKMKA
ncbi:MAG: Glyoxalase/bleomycin resistance protein/dioxygenase [Ilumatobacteraceae bacterium]|nr:Glyoxalase/bleomycin resistance protein/dioxygenase [Ilumatobacteraceae bacterium]